MAVQTISKSFTAVGAGGSLVFKHGDYVSASVSGTFSGTVILERSNSNGVLWTTVATFTAAGSGTYLSETKDRANSQYRFRCDDYTSGTIVTSISQVTRVLQTVQTNDGEVVSNLTEAGYSAAVRQGLVKFVVGGAKVGTTSGFVVGAANNKSIMATLPQSQTASTLVVGIGGLKEGDTITGFKLNGNIISAGGTVTVDAALRFITPAAAGGTDAAFSGGAITQLSVTANTLMGLSNAGISGLSATIASGVNYYLLITCTTGASTSIELDSVGIIYNEA